MAYASTFQGTNIFIGDHDQQNEMKNLVASVQPPEFGMSLCQFLSSIKYLASSHDFVTSVFSLVIKQLILFSLLLP